MDEAAQLHEKMLAMNEALLLGSLRQSELAQAAEKLNQQLRAEITERKRVESELTESMAIAEKANMAKSDFLSSMSHELRTPLSAILGFAQLMEAGSPEPTLAQKRSIDQILKAGWYLLDLINEILDLALIESGKLFLSMEPVSLAEVMGECQAMTASQAEKHGLRVTFPRFDGPCAGLREQVDPKPQPPPCRPDQASRHVERALTSLENRADPANPPTRELRCKLQKSGNRSRALRHGSSATIQSATRRPAALGRPCLAKPRARLPWCRRLPWRRRNARCPALDAAAAWPSSRAV